MALPDASSSLDIEAADQPASNVGSEKPSGDESLELPDVLYLLRDGSYGDRLAYEAEQADRAKTGAPVPWGKGALLLNRSTRSYLTPFGFRALFRQRPQVIRERFQHAGLQLDKNYFREHAPDILIHGADGRFIPPSHLPAEEEPRPLLLRVREDDIYLQNFDREGKKRTGSYTPYGRTSEVLRELHAEALSGIVADPPTEVPEEGQTKKRNFRYRPRSRGLSRRRSSGGGKQKPSMPS